LTGYPASDFIGNSVRDFASIIHPDDRRKVSENIQYSLSDKKSYTIEYRIICSDKREVWVQERGRGVLDPSGEVLWLDGVITDITMLKEAQQQMKLAMQMQVEFTSTVSHELRTPLTAIKEGIAIVLDGSAGNINDEQKDFLDTAKRNVDRLTRLINDVLDFHKLKAGKAKFNIEPGDINETIEDVYKQMLPESKKQKLDFKLDLDKAIPKINFDRDSITRVLINLVNNAFKFTERASVVVSSRQRPDENLIYVKVEDTGHGVRESDLSKLFEDFEQLDKGKDRKTGGTGLGLAISKKIITQHGGRIWAESELGKGSSLIFTLPIT
jgi:PAS domain S-box-containing protein